MINELSKKLFMKEAKENGIASSVSVPVHMSTYPLMLAKKSMEKKTVEASTASQAQPKVLAHFSYNGDRYKAGVRYPKSEMPKSHSYKKSEADSASTHVAVIR